MMKSTWPGVKGAAFGALGCAFLGDVLSAATHSWCIFGACAIASVFAGQVVGQVLAYDAADRDAGSSLGKRFSRPDDVRG